MAKWKREWIKYRNYVPGNIFYVASVPTKKDDWGYTTDPAKAIDLSLYWGRRFAADCRRVGAVAVEVPSNA